MNLAFKQYLHDHITEERLHDFGIMINSLKHIRKQFEQAWRHGACDPDDEEDHGEYSHYKDADIKAIVDALEDLLGGTVQEVDGKAAAFALARNKNPFAEMKRASSLGAKLRAKEWRTCSATASLTPTPPTAGIMEPRLVRSAVHVGLLVGGGEECSTSRLLN